MGFSTVWIFGDPRYPLAFGGELDDFLCDVIFDMVLVLFDVA